MYPIYNSKISLILWDERFLYKDTFIAYIPEIASTDDYFNLDVLTSKHGIMKYTWINMYGIPIHERPGNFDSLIKGRKTPIYGTQYFGKILISLSFSPSRLATLSTSRLTNYREPE